MSSERAKEHDESRIMVGHNRDAAFEAALRGCISKPRMSSVPPCHPGVKLLLCDRGRGPRSFALLYIR